MSFECPKCEYKHDDADVVKAAASINGRIGSKAKSDASRKNGEKGGRPRKSESAG